MQSKTILLVIALALVIVVIGAISFWKRGLVPADKEVTLQVANSEYNPEVDPKNFVSKIDNKYFTLKPGTKFTYENKTGEGLEKIEVVVTDEIREVLGINTTVVWDRVWLDDELIEETYDYYAQDKDGNVWYFGERVDNYENGEIKDHKGAWEAGVDAAKPGIIMKADPNIGDSYRQEYYQGQAEDMGDIVALDKKITVPYGQFENCLQTRDWSRVDTALNEYKYYCPEVGFVVLEESVADSSEKVELIYVSN